MPTDWQVGRQPEGRFTKQDTVDFGRLDPDHQLFYVRALGAVLALHMHVDVVTVPTVHSDNRALTAGPLDHRGRQYLPPPRPMRFVEGTAACFRRTCVDIEGGEHRYGRLLGNADRLPTPLAMAGRDAVGGGELDEGRIRHHSRLLTPERTTSRPVGHKLWAPEAVASSGTGPLSQRTQVGSQRPVPS